jgi:hypothetical protein
MEMEVSKVRLEAAGLRDALLKMQALNEGLGQDKVDLSKMLMQVCGCCISHLRFYCMKQKLETVKLPYKTCLQAICLLYSRSNDEFGG